MTYFGSTRNPYTTTSKRPVIVHTLNMGNPSCGRRVIGLHMIGTHMRMTVNTRLCRDCNLKGVSPS